MEEVSENSEGRVSQEEKLAIPPKLFCCLLRMKSFAFTVR
jgi:hypothetical protein